MLGVEANVCQLECNKTWIGEILPGSDVPAVPVVIGAGVGNGSPFHGLQFPTLARSDPAYLFFTPENPYHIHDFFLTLPFLDPRPAPKSNDINRRRLDTTYSTTDINC